MRYSRNIPALSQADCAALQGKTVAVIGCGGLGGHIIEQLARIALHAIHLNRPLGTDYDQFTPRLELLDKRYLSIVQHITLTYSLTQMRIFAIEKWRNKCRFIGLTIATIASNNYHIIIKSQLAGTQ